MQPFFGMQVTFRDRCLHLPLPLRLHDVLPHTLTHAYTHTHAPCRLSVGVRMHLHTRDVMHVPSCMHAQAHTLPPVRARTHACTMPATKQAATSLAHTCAPQPLRLPEACVCPRMRRDAYRYFLQKNWVNFPKVARPSLWYTTSQPHLRRC